MNTKKPRLIWNHKFKFWANSDSLSTGYTWFKEQWNYCWIEPGFGLNYVKDPDTSRVVKI